MKRIKPTTQVYSDYTPEDFSVWEILFTRQMENLAVSASGDYLAAIERIGFNKNEIPDFNKINSRLSELTGWKIITVPGICPPAEFFELLANKTFTCTCWLRKMEELDYLEEPDMFHDVFGHVPLLTNPEYCAFFQSLGILAMEHAGDQDCIDMLERLYWFTIEFGLIKENGKLKIYGSGIISSTGETRHALGDRSAKHSFDAVKTMNQHFRTDVMQDDYFVIDSFRDLTHALPLVAAELDKFKKEKAA